MICNDTIFFLHHQKLETLFVDIENSRSFGLTVNGWAPASRPFGAMHLGGEIAFADLDGATGLDRLWDAGHHAEEQQEANRCQYAAINHPDRRGEKAPHDQGDTDY